MRRSVVAESGKHFVTNYELAHMPSYSNYPPSLLSAMEVKSLIGRSGEIIDRDINVSAFHLDPGTDYGDHVHPHPEVYVFLSGTAECQWGDETFIAEPGTVTHCPPNMPHAMRVTSSEPLRAIIIGWAPDGDARVWDGTSVLLDPPPE
jgi:mannose-6-phosphate isomerase-like protein (cupin superfamily)